MNTRTESISLLNKYIEDDGLKRHCMMVGQAMEAYAKILGKNMEDIEKWWAAGVLHDLDWEKYPEEHPNKAVNEILPPLGYPKDVIEAIKTHAPNRSGKYPDTPIERYLFACDELSGFMYAVSLMRPGGFEGMKVKSVTKKLKTANFAANVSREDIHEGAALIDKELNKHIAFLIQVFSSASPSGI